MTEAEWIASEDPTPMLEALGDKASDRKLRLFAVACCRRFWDYLACYPETRPLVEAVEQFADGIATREEVEALSVAAFVAHMGFRWYSTLMVESAAGYAVMGLWPQLQLDQVTESTRRAAENLELARVADESSRKRSYRWWKRRPQLSPTEVAHAERAGAAAEQTAQSALLRDIIGNPFRAAALDPVWRTSTVVALAKQMYDSRDFGAMPILADALQDAGCDNDDILNHCRGPGPHVRGCWVVDLVLRKE